MVKADHGRGMLVGILLCCAGGAWLSGRLLIEHAGDFWHRSTVVQTNRHGADVVQTDRHGADEVQTDRHETTAGRTDWLGSLCDSGAALGFDCERAARSRWSEFQIAVPVPGGDLRIHKKIVTVPTAFVGLAYFVYLGTWFLFIGRPRVAGTRRHLIPLARWHLIPLTLVCLGAAASIGFLVLMGTQLAPRCVTCLLVHGVNLLLLVLTWRVCRSAVRERVGTPAERERHTVKPTTELCERQQPGTALGRREVACVSAFALILVAGLWAYRSEQLAFRRQYMKLLPYRNYVLELQQNPDFLTREFLAQPIREIPEVDGAARGGVPVLVIFTDFQCRSCACNWHQYKTEIAPTFGGELHVMVKHFPLCKACNNQLTEDVHSEACRAAHAVEATRLQGGDEAAWKMHELLFQHQKHLGEETYRSLASRLGLNAEELARDMESDLVRQAVATDVALARRLGVTATPTMFLDGREVPSLCRTPVFWKAIAAGRQTRDERIVRNNDGEPVSTSRSIGIEGGAYDGSFTGGVRP